MNEANQIRRVQTIEEFYETDEKGTVFLSSKERKWNGVEAVQARHSLRQLDIVPENHCVTLYIGRPSRVLAEIDNRKYVKRQTRGEIDIIPANQLYELESDGAINEDVYVSLTPAFWLEAAAGADVNPDRVELVPHIGFRDSFIEQIGLAYLAELKSPAGFGSLYAESLAHTLVVHLLRRYSSLAPKIAEYEGGLPPGKLRRAIDFIDAHLEDDVSLGRLAAEVRISPYHFARLFKQSTGQTPHNYLTARRIERAKQLLANTELSLVEIASDIGYSSQAHFTTIFRRMVGTTPGAFKGEQSNA